MSQQHIRLHQDVQVLKEKISQLETTVIRLMDVINTMQQQRKPGRKPKDARQTD